MSRYDVVIYGASGFTGACVVEHLVKSELFEGFSFAVAGSDEEKLHELLKNVSQKTEKDVSNASVIVARLDDATSLNAMARQAKVIVNTEGPYRLYGEAVVKAAVENGASHVDISGEPAWIEEMQMKYGEKAKEEGVYVVSACGWDSIPADLGVNFLKKNFNGDLNHVESIIEFHTGPSGYAVNFGTYQTLVRGLVRTIKEDVAGVRKEIMPEPIQKGVEQLPKRSIVSRIDEKELGGFAVVFPGADRSVVDRSQYYDATVRNVRPIHMQTYIRLSTRFYAYLTSLSMIVITSELFAYLVAMWAVLMSTKFYGYLIGAWIMTLSFVIQNPITGFVFKQCPYQCRYNWTDIRRPTAQQMAEASFVYWFFGYGYKETLPVYQQHEGKPNRKVVATCKGPESDHIATSGCVLSAALSLLKNRDHMPQTGGVYTSAAAFGETQIYDYLASFGITYQLESEYDL
uniref:Sacchrp_dh_NADP domain-containing protein n=1 Tax=Caenorhabditis tropicalis TaxID=1561998 RepID=A0A1I7TYA2_9PELO